MKKQFYVGPGGVKVVPAGVSLEGLRKANPERLEARVVAMIPDDPEVRKAAAFGKPVVLRSPDSPASKAIMKLAEDIAGVKKKVEAKEKKKEGALAKMLRIFRRRR